MAASPRARKCLVLVAFDGSKSERHLEVERMSFDRVRGDLRVVFRSACSLSAVWGVFLDRGRKLRVGFRRLLRWTDLSPGSRWTESLFYDRCRHRPQHLSGNEQRQVPLTKKSLDVCSTSICIFAWRMAAGRRVPSFVVGM